MSTAIDATIQLTEAPRGNVVYAGGISVQGVVLAAVNTVGRVGSANDPEASLNGITDFSSGAIRPEKSP
jgi:hypothetical protein